MSNPQVTIPRDKKTLEFFLDRALPENLAYAYQLLAPGMTIDDLFRLVLRPMTVGQVFGDELLKQVYERGNGVDSYQILLIACGYLAEAKVAHSKGDRRRAWSCAMDAMCYCASAKNVGNYIQDLPALLTAEVDQALSKKASNSAKYRTEPYKDVGAEAVRIIKTRAEGGKQWKSATAAAKQILDAMFDLAKSKGVPFNATDRGLKTITGYLTDAPELAPYFTEKRGRPKKMAPNF
jgi:hypothetical protein